MHPADAPPKFGAAPASTAWACPCECGFARPSPKASHCCTACAEGHAEHTDACARVMLADPTEQRAAIMAHLREQAAALRGEADDTAEGAASLKAGAAHCRHAHDAFQRAIQCTRWARDAELKANEAMAGVGAGGEGGGGLATEAQRSAGLKALRQRVETESSAQRARAHAAASLEPTVEKVQAAHEAYLSALQLLRQAENAGGGVAPADHEKLAQARSTAASAISTLVDALTALPDAMRDQLPQAFGDTSALPASVGCVADVQRCVACVAEKRTAVEGLHAAHAAQAAKHAAELPALEAGVEAEAKRGTELRAARAKFDEGVASLAKAFSAHPASLAARYPEASAPLLGADAPPSPFGAHVALASEHAALCARLREAALFGTEKASVCNELEALLVADGKTARERLVPIAAAIKALELSEAKLAKAVDEGSKAAEMVRDAVGALAATALAARRPGDVEALLQVELTSLAECVDERARLRAIVADGSLCAKTGSSAKQLEEGVRRELSAAKAELQKAEAAITAEELRGAKLDTAVTEADEAALILQSALATVPSLVTTRYPQQARKLTLQVQVPLLAADVALVNTRDRMEAFFGDSGGGDECLSEWASADRPRQALATLDHCAWLASQQEKAMGELEASLRKDSDAAREELKAAKSKLPDEEARAFADMRSRAC